jgi:hypothetical protein
VKSIALVLNAMCRMLGWLEWWWLGVFIALNHQTTVGVAAVDGCTGQSGAPPDTVRCASHVTQPLWFGSFWPLEALSSSGTGQSGAEPDRHCSMSDVPLTTALTFACTVRAL